MTNPSETLQIDVTEEDIAAAIVARGDGTWRNGDAIRDCVIATTARRITGRPIRCAYASFWMLMEDERTAARYALTEECETYIAAFMRGETVTPRSFVATLDQAWPASREAFYAS